MVVEESNDGVEVKKKKKKADIDGSEDVKKKKIKK